VKEKKKVENRKQVNTDESISARFGTGTTGGSGGLESL